MAFCMLTGFTHKIISAAGCKIDLQLSGNGSPVLLLHGFPQTKLAWHKIAPELAVTQTVILPDLPGYGDSTAPKPDAEYKNYSKRSMANVLVEVMQQLGFDQFAVAGHDRGARVAYRMALDHPQKIARLSVLNIIPTIDMVEHLDYNTAVNMHNWFFLAQPAPLPETLLQQNADFYLQHIFDTWSETPSQILPEAKAEYLRCFKKKEVIEAICAEYRATTWDIENDREDRNKNRRIHCPVHALWSKEGIPASIVDPLEVWKKWADKVSGTALDGGHFLMEENPEKVLEQLL
jgi:haloacetate dehalogenase